MTEINRVPQLTYREKQYLIAAARNALNTLGYPVSASIRSYDPRIMERAWVKLDDQLLAAREARRRKRGGR